MIVALARCTSSSFDPTFLASHTFKLADGSTASWSELRGSTSTVIITLDPECPFSQGYAPLIDSLEKVFQNDGIDFLGFYPAPFIDPDSAALFARMSGFGFPQVMDADCSLAIELHARVTPECFVIDASDRMIYRGAIDDWAVRTGRHKARATKHYLADALGAAISGGRISAAEVKAVGCIVECDGATPEE